MLAPIRRIYFDQRHDESELELNQARDTIADLRFPEDVDDEAPTHPGCLPLEITPASPGNDTRPPGAEWRPITWGEIVDLFAGIAGLGALAVVAAEFEHHWQLGGYLGLWVLSSHVVPAVVVGAMGWRLGRKR